MLYLHTKGEVSWNGVVYVRGGKDVANLERSWSLCPSASQALDV